MKDHKHHPAAHSGAPVKPLADATPQVSLSKAATHDMKVAKSAEHPASGCSPKHVGEVKHTTKP